MPYSAGDTKWGDPVLGEPSGTILWSQDYVDALTITSGYDAGDINTALLDAFDTWETVAAVDFQMVSSGASLTIGASSLDSGVAGVASYSFDSNPGLSEIYSANIAFSSDLTWSPYGDGGVDFYAIALHEIGHVLGLGHVNDTSEIMNPVVYADDLGAGDIAGVQYLYGTDGGDVDAPVPLDTGDDRSSGLDGDDGGGAGGVLGLLAGLLALVFGVFSGGGAAVAMVAAGRISDDDEGPVEPVLETHTDVSYLPLISIEEFETDPDRWFVHDDEDETEDWLI